MFVEMENGNEFIVPKIPTLPNTSNDNVNHPSYCTTGKIECIEALEIATEGLQGIEAVCTANAIKYLWRWKRKNGAEDLKKAKWYIDRLIDKLEEKKMEGD